MPFVSTGHLFYLIILLVIVLIIFGPGKLPDIGAGMGRAIREFRKASTEVRDSVSGAVGGETHSVAPPAQPASPPAAPAQPTPAPAQPVVSGSAPSEEHRGS